MTNPAETVAKPERPRRKRGAGWLAWGPAVCLPAAVLAAVPDSWPAWAEMWTLSFGIFCGCKWLTWQAADRSRVAWSRQAAYLLAWPGLDAVGFFTTQPAESSVDRPSPSEWLAAALKTLIGGVLFFGLPRLLPADSPILIGWVGMIGIVMALHFGGFHLLSCAWRTAGVCAQPLMDRPLVSVSLSEFWGRRWNTAFRDLTHRFLFRPLLPKTGALVALSVGFVFSGLVHDLVISLPARGGYGTPTLYFVMQGAGVLWERSRIGRRMGLGSGWRGWLFTCLILLVPVKLLFHDYCVQRVIFPFMQVLGAV